MDFLDAYHLWADAHAFFDSALVPRPAAHADPLAVQAARWESRLAEETPNGHLLRRNALFDALSGNGKLHLLHVTHALEEINRQGVLYPSGGCLVGSIYCAPLTASDEGFRMHNLGAYVLTKEAPAFLAKLGVTDRVPTPLIFEIDTPPQAYRGLAGVDYLRLGLIHLEIYSHLEYLLSKNERHRLRETVVSRVKNSAVFLATASAVTHQGAHVEADAFLGLLDETIPRLPILGYLYFEAVAEYLMLHSTSGHTRRLAELGELNNWLYKEMLFASFPAMAGKFDLARFRPGPKRLAGLIRSVDPTIDAGHASAYVVERISFLVAARLFAPGEVPDAWHHTRWEFDSLATQLGPLLGHLIHRELRTFGRYPDFYFYFDQHKALQAWNYWNHMDIVAPFNGTMPKGEVGINPAYPDLDYRVWRAEQDADGHLHPAEELALTIAPRLVDIKYTLMRNNQWTAPHAA
ncbi:MULTISPECIES: hypothetical protein [Streptomyces]|uniref:Uncharacterized protein n=1 Tax=Streptomyces evansiae TaxID=3075535 RepID=A0ABU2R2T2_9ACTN|nr:MULTISPECIES: hypothetical protein [unclassified Streptomyces]MDT0411012.1 hypothetical protein [Streptomyces sp. DSM 41979]MYQ58039.1 hypothetical protein [Streptomyces sp. SID4926]